MPPRVEWFGAAVEMRVRRGAKTYLRKLTREVRREVVKSVGRPWLGVPSRPGHPPKRRTGTLQASFRARVTESGGRIHGEVFSVASYQKFLELGTRKMAPRPHLVRALTKVAARMRPGGRLL